MAFLTSATRDALERLRSLDDGAASTPLERLAAARRLLAALEAEPAVLGTVRAALDESVGWAAIAEAAGLTPSAARWRWQGDDEEIAARHEAGRKRAERPSSKPVDLPGLSVADAAARLGITPQAVYLRVSRGQLRAETVTLADGRSYKRVFPE